MSNENQKPRSATERLNDLENLMGNLYQMAQQTSHQINTLSEAIRLLGNKVDSIAKAAEISDDTIAALMVENNVASLKAKVDDLIAKGILVAEAMVTEASFVVGRESDDTGKVVNPRIQFTLAALEPELKEKLVGATPGQTLQLKEGKYALEILETYAIQTPQAPQSEEAAPEAVPTEEAASS